MKVLKTALMLTLSLALATGALAADEAKKGEKGKAAAAKKAGGAKGKGGPRKAPGVTARFLRNIELSAEQKEKVAAIDKEFAAPAEELRKATQSILTKEQQEARRAAFAKARESKDKSPEARKALASAIKLTDEQKAKMVEIGKKQREMAAKVVAALKKVLTEEQAKNLPKLGRGPGKKGERPAGAKKPAGERKKKADAK